MSWEEHRVKKSTPPYIRKGHQLSYLAEQCSQVFPQPDPLAMPCQEQQPQACSSRSLLKEHFIKVFYFTFRERLLFALHKPVISEALQTVGEAVASTTEGCAKLWKAWNAECAEVSYAFSCYCFFSKLRKITLSMTTSIQTPFILEKWLRLKSQWWSSDDLHFSLGMSWSLASTCLL